MNILTTPIETQAQTNARAIVTNVQGIKTYIFSAIKDCIYRLDQPTIDVFGSNAAALFVELDALKDYSLSRLTANGDTEGLAQLSQILSSLPEVTINQDGTVTITPKDPAAFPPPYGNTLCRYN